jgi:hypothetical protein
MARNAQRSSRDPNRTIATHLLELGDDMISHRLKRLVMAASAALPPLAMATVAAAHGISEDQKARSLSGGYLQYVVLGAEHMLTGYDYLLFLFGVVFFLNYVAQLLEPYRPEDQGRYLPLVGPLVRPFDERFDLHADRAVRAHDRAGLERLCTTSRRCG